MRKKEKFALVSKAIAGQPDLSITKLCSYAKVSCSGFYNWKSRIEIEVPQRIEDELIQIIFHHRKGKAGARTIRMVLLRNFWLNVNLKKVRRIMKKYELQTAIRRKNKYRAILKFGEDHKRCPNRLKRQFQVRKRNAVYSTDITYLNYGTGLKAYLSAVKDLGTQEIVHYKLSQSMTLQLATDGLDTLFEKLSLRQKRNLIVHSDQGSHYTAKTYRELLKKHKIKQSMSRRGNCLDNAPIESFFGHMKDELDLKNCKSYQHLKIEVDSFMNYYNNERPQWGLKGKTPAECRGLT